MNAEATEPHEPIDRKTSRSICDAVGQRLQQDLRPQTFPSSSHLERLLEELRKQDDRFGHT